MCGYILYWVKFLLSVNRRLTLLIATNPKNRIQTSVREAIMAHVSSYKSIGFGCITPNFIAWLQQLQVLSPIICICGLVPNLFFTVIPYVITCISVRRPLTLKHKLPLTLSPDCEPNYLTIPFILAKITIYILRTLG